MAINGIHLNQLSNARQNQFHSEIDSIIKGITPEKLKIAELYTAFKAAYNRVDDGFQKVSKSEFTAKLQIVDKSRDQICIGMVEIIKGYLRDFDEDMKASATRLKILFDTYGNIASKPLYDQTAVVVNVLQDLNGKYKSDMEKLHLDRWADELKRLNDEFDTIAKQRLAEGVAKNDIVLKDARKDLDDAYRAIIRRIEAYIEIEGIANYAEFVKSVNLVIAKLGGGSAKSKTGEIKIDEEERLPAEMGGEVLPWDANEDYTKMKIGDKRQTSDGRIWEAIDLGQVHRDPTGEFGHFGWKEV